MRSSAAVTRDSEDSLPRLFLVEGIIGSGKTSTAKELSRRLHRSGREARWIREEAADHPVTPKSADRPEAATDRVDWWLGRWSRLLERDETADLVLEGTAFQSTVRMLYAALAPRECIDDYVRRFVEILEPADTRMIYLRRPHPADDLRERVLPLRGSDWGDRVASYCASTPIGRERGWQGVDGLVEFWCDYRSLCDELVESMDLRTLTVDPSRRAWNEVHDEIQAWLRGVEPQPT